MDAEVTVNKTATNVGYLFFPEFWNQGYATEATSALTFHWAQCGIKKMIAVVTEGNKASYRVLEKSGYTKKRTIRDNDTIRGTKYNDIEYIWLQKKRIPLIHAIEVLSLFKVPTSVKRFS